MAAAADLIVLDTIGKLYAHGHGPSGCAERSSTCLRTGGAAAARDRIAEHIRRPARATGRRRRAATGEELF
jgi:hypothetical protein